MPIGGSADYRDWGSGGRSRRASRTATHRALSETAERARSAVSATDSISSARPSCARTDQGTDGWNDGLVEFNERGRGR